MKVPLRELLSFFVTESRTYNDRLNKNELVNCPLREIMCKEHHSAINKNFLESEQYRKELDFTNSIDTLKIAFNRTTDLMLLPCTKCAQQFRSTIIESMENIHSELGKKTKGIFGKKCYTASYNKAESVLKEFENIGAHSSSQINDAQKMFLGNHLN